MLRAIGKGLTRIVSRIDDPEQAAAVGVITNVNKRWIESEFTSLNDGILPDPDTGNPLIAELEDAVQEKVVPATEELSAIIVELSPEQMV